MLNRLIYSLRYRIKKLNSKKVIGMNNLFRNSGCIHGSIIEVFGNNNTIEIGKNTVLEGVHIFIKGNNILLQIGENVSIKGGELWLEDNSTKILIDSNTTIEKAHIAVTEDGKKITIGMDCMIAKEVEIRSGDSHSILNEFGERINLAENVVIGNHVWIGNRAIILKGVNLGDSCIVGTGSIVTKSFDANSLIAGIPAGLLKSNLNWTRERIS